MPKDRRYQIANNLISGGFVKTFSGIFDAIPKSVVYRDLGMNYNRFTRLINNPDQFTLGELAAIAKLIGCDPKIIIDFAWHESLGKRRK